MDVDATFKSIRSIYQTICGRADFDVMMNYKSPTHGVTKVFHIKVDAREFSHETHEGALTGLLIMLKKELADKVKGAEAEANRLKLAYNQLAN